MGIPFCSAHSSHMHEISFRRFTCKSKIAVLVLLADVVSGESCGEEGRARGWE